MKPQHSPEFKAFASAQHQVNQFLWSSEFAYELILQDVLTAQVRAASGGVHQIFAGIDCHAFKPSTKATRAQKEGKVPRHSAKYQASVAAFENHLRDDLESIARYVIIRFHSALERFIWVRSQPFLHFERLNHDEFKKAAGKFQRTDYHKLETALREKTSLRTPIDRKKAQIAQCYRMLRNEFIHKEDDWAQAWTDADFRASIKSTFHEEASALIHAICDSVDRRTNKKPHTSALFFYALFCLTDYRNFATEVEGALPLPPHP